MSDTGSPLLLAIEASGPEASVALGRGDSLLHCEPVSNAARHDDDLMPAISRAFEHITASPKDLELICVSVGPGGFTGLRIAISTAKMIAFALKCPLVAVNGAEAILQAEGGSEPLAICLSGKNGAFWTAFGAGAEVSEGQLLTESEVIARASSQAIRRIAVSQRPDRIANLAELARTEGLALAEIHPDAADIWAVGRRLAASGRFVAPEHLVPIYPREPEAVRLWKQRQSRS